MEREYAQALEYLYSNLPVFQRIGPAALKKDLTNTIALCKAFNHPEHTFKTIHVAGTNGKGSVSHMLSAILQCAGYKTGLYTSPHLKDFTERIRVNGHPVAHEYVVEFVNGVKPLIEKIKPSFFEITVIMAFEYFKQQQVDVAVIETGLGGRLDSTNVITPELSIITNIGMDHANILGNSLEMIAKEKAGIIKVNVPVVISERQTHSEVVFIEEALSRQANILFASDHYRVVTQASGISIYREDMLVMENINIELKGTYQQMNVAGVLQAVETLKEIGYKIEEKDIKKGLEQVVTLTGLKGRWQRLGEHPLVVCDTGHNVEGITQVVNQIKEQSFRELHMVVGFVNDKDIDSMLRLLPISARYYFCQAEIPRALEAVELQEKAKVFGLMGVCVKNVNAAIAQAKQIAHPDDMIFVGGSTFLVAEINEL